MNQPGNNPLNDMPELAGLRLQPGFVEGIIADRKKFKSLEKAFAHIFRRNLEFAIMLWNGIPVKFSYQQDLAVIADNLISMLSAIQDFELSDGGKFAFQSPNLHFEWLVSTTPEHVDIIANWNRVPGGYEGALNALTSIRVQRLEFLCEWKLLLNQSLQAIDDAQAVVAGQSAQNQLSVMRSLEQGIPHRGKYYQY